MLGFTNQKVFFRVDMGMTLSRNTTALDVVMFERNEHENEEEMDLALKVAQQNNIDLSQYNWRDIVWATKTREAAFRYATAEEPEEADEEIEEVHIGNALILAEDGDDGFLILDVKTKN